MIVWVVVGLMVVLLLGVVAYWQLAVAEGAYLGQNVVTWLYDRFATRYDGVKQYIPALDTVALAVPIMKHLNQSHGARSTTVRVLDVATGTGRLPETLLNQANFCGHVTAIDLSARMLAIAEQKLRGHSDRVTLLHQDAQHLTFENESFDVVTSLEALEFFPDQKLALHEMMRVLKPGGLLIITNRIGPDAWKLPGRNQSTASLATWLEKQGLRNSQTESWLIDYDLIRATK